MSGKSPSAGQQINRYNDANEEIVANGKQVHHAVGKAVQNGLQSRQEGRPNPVGNRVGHASRKLFHVIFQQFIISHILKHPAAELVNAGGNDFNNAGNAVKHFWQHQNQNNGNGAKA